MPPKVAAALKFGAGALGLAAGIAWVQWSRHYRKLVQGYDCWPPLSPTRLGCIPDAVISILAIACAVVALGAFVVAAARAWRSWRRNE